jgi:hypothetical protein
VSTSDLIGRGRQTLGSRFGVSIGTMLPNPIRPDVVARLLRP